MSLINDIVVWAKSLPAWQGDAVARLFKKGQLSQNDLDELYAVMKAEHGIPDPEGRAAQAFSLSVSSQNLQSTQKTEIVALKNLIKVNAIAENQRLEFAQKGLTVIYGDNGSGKSGYSRVLKKACRARDQDEPILPNANAATKTKTPASATFEVIRAGVNEEVLWNDDSHSPDALSSFAVFDSRCARAYLDDEDDFSYVPYGLDILESLANVCKRFDTQLKSERANCVVDKSAFAELASTNTAVGKLLTSLGAATKPSDVEKLSTLSDIELGRRNDLEKSLKADNPKEKAGQLVRLATRVLQIATNVDEKSRLVGDDVAKKLIELVEAGHVAKSAAELAMRTFKQEGTFLPGTGGDAWKELFDAARKYSTEALPDQVFPEYRAETPCLLCQQPLGGSVVRLQKFEAFIQQEAEKKLKDARKAYQEYYKPFDMLNLTVGLDDVLYKELSAIDEILALDTRQYELSLSIRHSSIKNSCAKRDWDSIKKMGMSPHARLKALADALSKEARDLEKAADDKARIALENEFKELDARLKLNKIHTAVVTAVEKYVLDAKLEKCVGAVRTTSISSKSTELTQKAVSKDLETALNREFDALGAVGFKVSLSSRAAKGKTLHKLKLELPQATLLSDLLSEGEQRAIAIGSFLAEVNVGTQTGGIIFDDPVSSLDHRRRELVARRLAEEAQKRQVIVFTHDTYFACVLLEAAELAHAPVLAQMLTKRSEGFGVPENDFPIEAKSTSKRIGQLRNMHQQIAAVHKSGNEPECRKLTIDAYRYMRDTWERATEEVLLQKAVERFRKGIETQRLASVIVSDSDYQVIHAGMTKCSNYSHDKAAAGGVAVPGPNELLKDIEALDTWRAETDRRGKDTKKSREARS